MAEKKNISSGAEKAEKLALANKSGTERKAKNKGAGKNSGSVKSTKNASSKKGKSTVKHSKEQKKAEGVKQRKEKRAHRAQINAERKQKRLERRLAHKEHKEERRARLLEKREERKQRRAELKEIRAERKAMLKSEDKNARRERLAKEKQAKREARAAKREAYLADKKAKREHALKVRADKRAARYEKGRTPGFGGWLAAVITLGVTTLALGTVVTFGALTMNGMQADTETGYTQSIYELNSIVDELDCNLARARASSSVGDRVSVLSDIAVESRTAETVIERLPLDERQTEQLTSFINKMGDSAKDMLATVAKSGELTPSQIKTLDYMYENNRKLKREINELTANCKSGDLRGEAGKLFEGFAAIQNDTFSQPEGIEGGAFGKVEKLSAAYVEGLEEITAQTAEDMAKEYFKGYKVSEANCTGEAVADSLTVYNVSLTVNDGEMLAQLSKKGGKLVAFDSYKDCSDKNFSVENCTAIAAEFLEKVGYGHLEAVWASESGVTCNITFAPVENDAVIYTDKVLVKVCEQRGIVTGVEAIDYVMHHAKRDISAPSVSVERARDSINGNIDVTSTRKAVIPVSGKDVLCYEFAGEMDGVEYYIYVDAATGEELLVKTVVGTATGRVLK